MTNCHCNICQRTMKILWFLINHTDHGLKQWCFFILLAVRVYRTLHQQNKSGFAQSICPCKPPLCLQTSSSVRAEVVKDLTKSQTMNL